MIASTLTTAGMENCNVIAACPFEVSGTGALTGIIMAYEQASGENLDERPKRKLLWKNLSQPERLRTVIGQEKGNGSNKRCETEVLDQGLTDEQEIGEAVDNIAQENEVTLTDDQRQQIVSLMEKFPSMIMM